MVVWIIQRFHIADLESDVRQPTHARFAPRYFEQVAGQIDADHRSARTDGFGRGQGRRAGAATDIEDAHAGTKRQPVDRVASVPRPEAERLVVEMIRRRIISLSRLQFGGIRDDAHWPAAYK